MGVSFGIKGIFFSILVLLGSDCLPHSKQFHVGFPVRDLSVVSTFRAWWSSLFKPEINQFQLGFHLSFLFYFIYGKRKGDVGFTVAKLELQTQPWPANSGDQGKTHLIIFFSRE